MEKKFLSALIFTLLTLFLPKCSLAGVELAIDFPLQGMTLDYTSPTTPIAGYVYTNGSHNINYKVIIALDASGSTAAPCGMDLDKDGVIGRVPTLYRELRGMIGEGNTDPGDSIFAAEILAARKLLRLLDPDLTQVGLVSFSGGFEGGGAHSNITMHDAYLEHPLTKEYALITEVLNRVKTKRPAGGTNVAAGIRLGIEALMGLMSNTHSPGYQPNDHSKKIIFLLSDGFPSFPVGSANVADPEDKILTVSAAHLAYLAGIQINTYALGPDALSSPFTLQEIARVTGGRFTGLSNPGEILTRLEEARFITLRNIEVENITLTKPASEMLVTPEGFFFALVPLTEGLNKVRVSARATDGSVAEKLLSLYWFKPEKQSDIALQLDLARDHVRDLKLTLAKEKERLIGHREEILDLELQVKPKSP